MSARPARRTARLLGLTSLGLGTSMLVSPTGVARFAGVDDSPVAVPVITAVGARELAHAAGLLAGRPGWAWTRVLGDAVDLTAMSVALSNRRGAREQQLRNVLVGASALALLDLLTALRSRRRRTPVPSSDARPGGTGLVAPLIDVRPALAGEPRRPVVPASVAATSDVRASDALAPEDATRETATPDTLTSDILTPGTTAPATPVPATPVPATTTPDTTTPDTTTSDIAAGERGGPAVS
ncbi:hypothetical protein SAMN05660657_00602 [Geodermatophilus amargosae]|uniref:Uncharacterized protein n=1 Tax=Geodermatophilus amargosae TaxID=1296565 RepID=A0A1I6XSG8_9ACTN|nr:hypothetical protein [Geodermatophilus amargosae]SFT40983.1 hypothetical protein SAMN05660657_00602 [Geodermatophilus amargosae]